MNSINIVGRLTRDPERRSTTSGKTVTNFAVAVDKQFKPQGDGPTADFFNVTAWGNQGDYVANYLTKGRLVAVSGRMESRQYDKDGTKVTAWELVADRVQGLDRPKDDAPGAQAKAPSAATDDEDDPFRDE